VPHCHYLKSLGISQEELPALILARPQVLVSSRAVDVGLWGDRGMRLRGAVPRGHDGQCLNKQDVIHDAFGQQFGLVNRSGNWGFYSCGLMQQIMVMHCHECMCP
jgi:hypothetical protein